MSYRAEWRAQAWASTRQYWNPATSVVNFAAPIFASILHTIFLPYREDDRVTDSV